jgi:hypothetical protein
VTANDCHYPLLGQILERQQQEQVLVLQQQERQPQVLAQLRQLEPERPQEAQQLLHPHHQQLR